MLKRCLAGVAGLLLASIPSLAQQQRAASVPTNGTIAVTSTFQQLLPRRDDRKGCTFQNKGSNTMSVFTGRTASATTANSFSISAGQTFNCSGYGALVIIDELAVTGTSGDAYVVTEQ